MRSGVVRLRGQGAVGPFAGVLAVNFEVDDGSGEGSELLPRGRLRVRERAANCCVRCEAVLVAPKSGPAPTTSTQRRPAASKADTDLGTEAETDSDTDTEIDTEIDLAAPASSDGNGHGPASGNGNGSSASPTTTTDPPTSSN